MELSNSVEEKWTPFEKRYLPYISKETDASKRLEISRHLAGVNQTYEEKKGISELLAPNQGFIDAYNVRALKQQKVDLKKKSQHLYNEEGKRFGRNWDYEGYRQIHDPLRIFEKKANYEDLAWKVFNEVEDSQTYLKVLYFPKLTSEDMHDLLDKFEDQYRILNNTNRWSYLLSAGSALGSWGIAYKFRFKFTSFLLSTALAYVITYKAINSIASNKMNRDLNAYARSMSRKYPEIKFSRVEYTKSSEITKPKLV